MRAWYCGASRELSEKSHDLFSSIEFYKPGRGDGSLSQVRPEQHPDGHAPRGGIAAGHDVLDQRLSQVGLVTGDDLDDAGKGRGRRAVSA